MPLDRWHPGCWRYAPEHPCANRSCADLLDSVEDPVARRYLRVAAHADLATEPHLTNGLNGLQNFLMDVPGYVGCYAILGGMGNLARRLEQRNTTTRFELGARIERIECTPIGRYEVDYVRDGRPRRQALEALVLALPLAHLE